MNQSIGNLVSAVTLFVGSLFMMFKTDVIMTITAIVATLIGFVLRTVIAKRSSRYFVRQQRCLGEINGHIEEIYTGHTVVKAYNGEAQATAEFERMNNNLRESAFRAQCLAGLMPPIMTFIGNLGYVAVCVAGAVLTMKGTIGFEVIVAFMMYVRYLHSRYLRSHRRHSLYSQRQQQVSVSLSFLRQRRWMTRAIRQRRLTM